MAGMITVLPMLRRSELLPVRPHAHFRMNLALMTARSSRNFSHLRLHPSARMG